ncbi:hypothetical protein [Frigoribacterium sp. PhB24]|uniref:hypothetical protein n=1 Tax=Frigoribacterium sp. PhB24 TaxID=2485204 RepID=UPI000F46CC1A|nr:hypothetical protein [Frigoribacterium sp. PhB24]ROS54269.1 hypothetical protein EDF50_0347 [Frigoribacterium sp. PhB24]
MTNDTTPHTPPDDAHRRPDGLDDDTVAALGELSAALEVVEQARGFLYGFHRLTGKADLALGEAVDSLRGAGHAELADLLERDLIGRNVIEGRWTYQLVEDYDEGYYAAFRGHEHNIRHSLADGKKHLFEAEMKEARRTHGRRHHEALPHESAGEGVVGRDDPAAPLA